MKNCDPFLDEHGFLRVDGCICEANLSQVEKNLLAVPDMLQLILKHYCEQTCHQGCLFTEGAVCAEEHHSSLHKVPLSICQP